MRILYFDKSNVCNSPSAAALLNAGAMSFGMPGVRALSAGGRVRRGVDACPQAPALYGVGHRPMAASEDLVAGADLILVMQRGDMRQLGKYARSAQTRTFTVTQAGRWSAWLLEKRFPQAAIARAQDPGGWREDYRARTLKNVAPMPPDPAGRVAWAVGELNAARGVGPSGFPPTKPGLRQNKKLGPLRNVMPDIRPKVPAGPHPDDLPDPHGEGITHEDVYRQLVDATRPLLQFLSAAGIGRY